MKKTNRFRTMMKALAAALILSITIFTAGCSSREEKVCSHNFYLSDYNESSDVNGYKEFTCSDCGDRYREILPAKESQPMEAPHAEPEETAAEVPTMEPEEDLTREKYVTLFDLPVYSSENVFAPGANNLDYMSEKTDTDGWKHTNCYEISCSSALNHWVRYELNGKYTTLTGKLYKAEKYNSVGWLEFYDGDEFLATTPRIDSNNTSVQFEFDITGVDYLTVYFRASDFTACMLADDIVLTKK